jgi:hypothetical protein
MDAHKAVDGAQYATHDELLALIAGVPPSIVRM